MKKLKYIFIFGIIFAVVFFFEKDKIMKKAQEFRLDLFSEMKESAMIKEVPFIRQLPELPRGCEVTSLTMLLQHKGVQVDKMQLASEIHRVPFKQDGLHGNPYEGFVGNIYTKAEPGYGVYNQPIFNLAEKYVPEKVINLTGRDVQDLYKVISSGSPVWVIINTTFKPLAESSFETWNTSSGKVKITYYEHSVVVIGYDQNFVYVNDPLANNPRKAVPRAEFEKAWEQMGKQAITIL
ncbi:C39 family peptidase [Bacillus mycoides]|nr:C39 family peptidase [Bacillus mycoides]MED0885117.1 C39 family peptidase [Bacillus mycoides]MED0927991.1 C39 family peptidase [Bacillus mycoides]MED1435761.1 C39 family peptidase [Bacillus mycoides]QWI63389.1 peptidase C39 family protein [Bacillus mycoides]UNP84131.1 C39 family peptidase [Bacillus mycoides]